MKSYKLARKLQKCGLFAVNEDEDGSVRTNFLNPTFLALLLIRCIAIGSFLYFLIINAILLKLSIPFILIIGVNTFGTIGSQLYTFILPFTAQRFGTNTFTGESQMSLKAQIMALIPFLMFITGNVLNQVSGFDQTLPWISKICLIVTLCFINVFGFIDCAAVVLVFYSWIIDLKLKINRTLTESKSQLSHYDKIYHDYSKLKNAMEPITFMIFCLVQLLCIASVYLAFTGKLIFYLEQNQKSVNRDFKYQFTSISLRTLSWFIR